MLHGPNESEPWHPERENTRFFAEAIVEMGSDFLVQEFVEFLPTPASCGHCGALAWDDGAYQGGRPRAAPGLRPANLAAYA